MMPVFLPVEVFKRKNQKMIKDIDTFNKYFEQFVGLQFKATVESFLQVLMNNYIFIFCLMIIEK